jgi:SAM-dependent methyltransferase
MRQEVKQMKDEEVRKIVREGYGEIAVGDKCGCGPVSACGCCNPTETVSKAIGYTDEELGALPDGADLGLGCGNPTALASLKEGEVVLDLGAGAGIDCFLAGRAVGESGKVIGVDMTAEMIERARENARKVDSRNVEFRLGEIENLPVADNSVDVVISNCVINLSPDKVRVFKEAYRALKPGGRMMISDIVLLKELPDVIKSSAEAYIGCLSGALLKADYLNIMESTGFGDIEIVQESSFPIDFMTNDPTSKAVIDKLGTTVDEVNDMAASVMSIKVRAIKPAKEA